MSEEAMTEHESNLLDLYAGLAMMGMLAHGGNPKHMVQLAHQSFDMADTMLLVREEILEDKRQYEAEERTVSDVAVPDSEGREDSDAQGIAALKKTKARSKSA